VLIPRDDPRMVVALEALAEFVRSGRGGRGAKLSLEKVDGEPVVGSDLEPLLIELGFRAGPSKLTLSA
jgi:ATP-dependent Lhr-like helicase